MRIAGTDAASNQSVEIDQIEDGIRLTTTSGAINIPLAEITDFSFDAADARYLNLAGPVSMTIVPNDLAAATPIVESIRKTLTSQERQSDLLAGLFDHEVAEPAAPPGDVEDTSGYVRPYLPATAIPPPTGPANEPVSAISDFSSPRKAATSGPREATPTQLILKALLFCFAAVAIAGVVAGITRTLTIEETSITAAERTARFFSTSMLTVGVLVLTFQAALLLRFVSALRFDETTRTLPLIGPLDLTLSRANTLVAQSQVIAAITVGLAALAAVAAVVDQPLAGPFWLGVGVVLACLILALSTTVEQLRSQLDGSIDLGEGHRI